MDLLPTVARFRANSDRVNLNCNSDPTNSKSTKIDEIPELGITQDFLGQREMVTTYRNLYTKICSYNNLERAFKKTKRGKSFMPYVVKFKDNLGNELNSLKQELENFTYQPKVLKRFIIRDPKTRVIHISDFRDRVVHHALVNIIEPIYEKIFIFDSYASRKNKGTHNAVMRFDEFKRKVANNGQLIQEPHTNNSVSGYVLKADIKHYFDNVNQKILVSIIRKKIKDEKVSWLIKQILNNFNEETNKGMPLGNLTSQFFANVYLNELDYFVKHKLKAKFYIRYVDDFVILHEKKEKLDYYKNEISNFLDKELKLGLHPDKTKIIPLSSGLSFLGYRIFYNYKLLRRVNLRKFQISFDYKIELYKNGDLTKERFEKSLRGWMGYAMWANTYKMRKETMDKIKELE